MRRKKIPVIEDIFTATPVDHDGVQGVLGLQQVPHDEVTRT